MSTGTVASIPAALAAFADQWQPHLLAQVNDHDVKIARVQGDFVWHAHPDSDELFLVVSGELTLRLRDRDVIVGPQEIFTVPAGVEHCPSSIDETVIVMVELRGTVNTGDAGGERTVEVRSLDCVLDSPATRPRYRRRSRP
jgi:mannose-6-phosphate isomerase-like protein (cupin superfamily)